MPNDAQVLMLVDGAVHDDLSRFERCVFIFDGNDETALATARADWSRLKAEGFELTIGSNRRMASGKSADDAGACSSCVGTL